MFFILHLSRTPIREALIELNKVGLVEIQPQRGSCIAKIDYELIGVHAPDAGECRIKAGLRKYFTGIYGQTKRISQDGDNILNTL